MPLCSFFKEYRKLALAFSGGVDSAYLLYAAKTSGADVRAYYVKTEFQPAFELHDAKRLADELGADMRIVELSNLECELVRANGPERCYHCKKRLFTAIAEAAAADGYELLIDGTNASDDAGDRPGMRALRELSVRSPLREAGLTKDDVRRLSREAGLFTWDKPAYACLATRIPCDTEITLSALTATENAEALLSEMGFRDFRVRMVGKSAKLQIREEQIPLALEHRKEIIQRLSPYYDGIMLDLEARA